MNDYIFKLGFCLTNLAIVSMCLGPFILPLQRGFKFLLVEFKDLLNPFPLILVEITCI